MCTLARWAGIKVRKVRKLLAKRMEIAAWKRKAQKARLRYARKFAARHIWPQKSVAA